jgi:hypothetical protein
MAKMGKYVKPLDPKEATLDVDSEVQKQLGKGSMKSVRIAKFGGFPGKNSQRIAFNLVLEGADDLEKHPVVLRISSRDARQLGRLFAKMADLAEGIE